ncbi:hypothetical protein N7460_006626 [Penicillium canescens]|uniref:Nephrocystin 3-like N-terminal domain-containing protein n=2 Tax=Penicillium canescens TaxID=5083 RepID=A0AAD6N891_PENCN|nr:hypothetical protein N7460_006626 [Penicillium canescens]KAJ6065974.1 hypothetical protein N7444_001627 [Penicillium canescens]
MDSTSRLKVLNWLSPIDHENQQSDAFSQCQSGTGKWFLESEEFKRLLREPKEALLCQGIPGAGKTVMASIVINHLQGEFPQRDIGIAYVFCSFRQHNEQTLEDLLSGFLKQLAQQQPEVPGCITTAYGQFIARGILPSVEKLIELLISVINSYGKVFMVLDALDEINASDGTTRSLIATLFEIQKEAPISFLATSRHAAIANILSVFRSNESQFLDIRASDEDVRTYIDGQLDTLRAVPSKDSKMRESIKDTIVKSVDGI